MEGKPKSIADILKQKPEAMVHDYPVPQKENLNIDNQEIIRISKDIDEQIQKLESDHQKIFNKTSALFPMHEDITSMIDDLDPKETIGKLRKVQYELQKLLTK